jgi:streptomycin 6-kinase
LTYASQLPEAVRLRAVTLGDSGKQWLTDLDTRVEQLESRWSMKAGQVLGGGSESLVTEVEMAGHGKAILKVGLPGSADLSAEANVYRIASGRGYAQLLAHDAEHNAVLLEKLGPTLANCVSDTAGQITVLCKTLKQAWRPMDNDRERFMTGAEKAHWLASFITERASLASLNTRTVRTALNFCEQRADAWRESTSVLIHGDAHEDNSLVTGETDDQGLPQCKFVDPDGLFAEKACDLAVPMRGWNEELIAGDTLYQARERCDLLASLTDVDTISIWQWGFMERVSTGLVLMEIGMKKEGVAYLTVAERTAEADPQ